jgi:hypothetical protein
MGYACVQVAVPVSSLAFRHLGPGAPRPRHVQHGGAETLFPRRTPGSAAAGRGMSNLSRCFLLL